MPGGFFLPLLALAATAYVLGRGVLWRLPFGSPLERGAVSSALGLGLLAHALLLLGLAGLLKPLPVLLLALAVHGAGWRVWRELWAERRPPRPLLPAWVAACLLALAPLLLLALYPPTAFDATLYHLPFARAFVTTGALPFLSGGRFPVFPQANEILFAAVMLFGPDLAAHGVQLLATLLTALLLAAWGGRPAGWLAAAVYLGNPIVVYLAGTAYIEPGLALFTTAAIHALDRWRAGGGRAWLALAAVFAATAADAKYLGLLLLGLAGLAVLLAGGRARSAGTRLRDGLFFTAVALAVLAPWYLRIYLWTGNPLFPFLPGVFGRSLWTLETWDEGLSLGGRLVRWLRIPWDVVFNRRSYNQQPPFSPAYLAAIPVLALGVLREARVRLLLAIAGAYALACMWLPADSRYLAAVLPLASLAVGESVFALRWPGRLARPALAVLCVGCFLPGWLYAGYRIFKQGPLPLTSEAREAYLDRSLPLHPAIAWLNRTRGSRYTLWALHAENMTYFAAGRFLGDWNGPAGFVRVLDGLRGPADLGARLRRLGADHLLVTVEKGGLPFPEDEEFRRWFEPVYADGAARIYELRPTPAIMSRR